MASTNVYYRVVGNGDPIIFLHGFLESSSMWEDVLPFFKNKKCILIDFPGFGKSPLANNIDWSFDSLCEYVLVLLSSLKIDECSVIGHSMGGYLAIYLAEKKEFQKVVLMNSHPWEDSIAKKEDRLRVSEFVYKKKQLFIQEALPALFLEPKKFQKKVNAYVNEALKIDAHSIAKGSLAMRNRKDTSEIMRKNPERFSVIQGKFDRLILAENMNAFCKEFSIDYHELSKAGHMSQVESLLDLKKVFQEIFNL